MTSMEDVLQVIRDMMGHTPHSIQESMQAVPNSLPSCETTSFDQPVTLLERSNECPNMEHKWRRVRWTNEMVRVLITAASYVVDHTSENEEGNHVRCKWKCISNTMIERGYVVSRQQCEDKFHDMNKKYKRLKRILGTTASYQVVENPALLETMNIPDEAKLEVRKILSCKHLFFREMYSYHNRDRRFLPHDHRVQESVVSFLKGGVLKSRDLDSETQSAMNKRQKLGEDRANGVDDSEWMTWRSVHLEEKKMEMDKQKLELEKKKLEWLNHCGGEDKDLDHMKLQNQLMKIQNQRLAFHLQCRQTGHNT